MITCHICKKDIYEDSDIDTDAALDTLEYEGDCVHVDGNIFCSSCEHKANDFDFDDAAGAALDARATVNARALR